MDLSSRGTLQRSRNQARIWKLEGEGRGAGEETTIPSVPKDDCCIAWLTGAAGILGCVVSEVTPPRFWFPKGCVEIMNSEDLEF